MRTRWHYYSRLLQRVLQTEGEKVHKGGSTFERTNGREETHVSSPHHTNGGSICPKYQAGQPGSS